MERQDVESRLNRALAALAGRDGYLLENNLSERCIAARLAMHLQEQFSDHKVDVEYNRQGRVLHRRERGGAGGARCHRAISVGRMGRTC